MCYTLLVRAHVSGLQVRIYILYRCIFITLSNLCRAVSCAVWRWSARGPRTAGDTVPYVRTAVYAVPVRGVREKNLNLEKEKNEPL